MKRSITRELGAALAQELASAAGAIADSPARVVAGSARAGAHLRADITVSGAASGACAIAFDAESAAAFARALTGREQMPADAVIDTIRELCSQAIGSLALKPAAGGATLTLGTIAAVDGDEPVDGVSAFVITVDRMSTPLTFTFGGDVTAAAAERDALVPARRHAPSQDGGTPLVDAAPGPERLDVIMDIDLPLVVRFGRTELPLQTLTRIGPGSLIDLERSPDDPVEILVSNRVVARGEVVIVSGNYGIRILDVVSPAQRL